MALQNLLVQGKCLHYIALRHTSDMASEISGNSPGSQAVFLANNKETPKFHITGFRERNSPGTGGFPSKRASDGVTVPMSRHPHAFKPSHYNDVTMGAMASQIASLTIVYSTVYSGADQRKHQSSASLTFVRGIHGRPVNSPHTWPVTRKMFPFDDVMMEVKGKMITTWNAIYNFPKTAYTSVL